MASANNPFQNRILVETVPVSAEIILNKREKGRRRTISLAIECIVARNPVAADEEDCQPPGTMVIVVSLPIQHDKACIRLHEASSKPTGVCSLALQDMRSPSARSQDVLGNILLMSDRITAKLSLRVMQPSGYGYPFNAIVDVNEAVRCVRQGAEFHGLPVASAPRIIHCAGTEEIPAVERGRTVRVQPCRQRLRIPPENIDYG